MVKVQAENARYHIWQISLYNFASEIIKKALKAFSLRAHNLHMFLSSLRHLFEFI